MTGITFEQLPSVVSMLFSKVENIERLLHQRSKPQQEADELLTIQQAAQFIHLTVPTVYGLVHNSQIPVSKKGKRLYFSKQELTDWIKEGRRKTVSEIKAEATEYLVNKRKGGK